MKEIRVTIACLVITAMSITSCQRKAGLERTVADTTAVVQNILTADERSEGWELLFDGNSLSGWKRYNNDTIGSLWTVENEAIVCNAQSQSEHDEGSLVTVRHFGNFDLKLEWMISSGGNSGILYHVNEKPEYKSDYETGPEYQLLDDAGWKGETLKPEQKCGSNYDMYAASNDKITLSAGEWNTARIVYNNGHVEHWMNGKKVVEFNESDAEYTERYRKSKWVNYPAWNTFKQGAISLQEHDDPVYFRNIKIKTLP